MSGDEQRDEIRSALLPGLASGDAAPIR